MSPAALPHECYNCIKYSNRRQTSLFPDCEQTFHIFGHVDLVTVQIFSKFNNKTRQQSGIRPNALHK